MIFADAMGRMLLVDPTPASTAASRRSQLAATGKLQPSMGENTADAAVGIDSAPLAVTTFSHNVSPNFCFLLKGTESCVNQSNNGPLLFFSVATATGQCLKLGGLMLDLVLQ